MHKRPKLTHIVFFSDVKDFLKIPLHSKNIPVNNNIKYHNPI